MLCTNISILRFTVWTAQNSVSQDKEFDI